MHAKTVVALACMAVMSAPLSGCLVAPDEVVWLIPMPTQTPAQLEAEERRTFERQGLCIKPSLPVIGMGHGNLHLRQGRDRVLVLVSQARCFTPDATDIAIVPRDPAKTCLAADYQVTYTTGGGQTSCAVDRVLWIRDRDLYGLRTQDTP